jgi:hypothetical protein
MNRREHLLRSSAALSLCPFHQEHLILDWSSSSPLRRAELPEDPRIRLERVEGEAVWNLCRAYNFAIHLAHGDLILKLDADCWPAGAFDLHRLTARAEADAGPGSLAGAAHPRGICAFGSGLEGRKGQFLIDRSLFDAVGGFNEYLVGYGFDDKDLKARLRVLTGSAPEEIPSPWLEVIAHSDAERAELRRGRRLSALEESLGLARMRASRLANRFLVAHYPWSASAAASQYARQGDGTWRALPQTIPSPDADIADEIDHARRMVFWGCFLGIPEIFLEVLPFKLFPPARDGRWPVRWWHRLYWHTGRRLLELPVWLLSSTRGWLMALRRGLGRA